MDKTFRQNTKMLSILKGLLVSYLITAFVLLLLSFLMLKLDLSSAVISGGINFAYIASAFIGGFIVGKLIDTKKFLWGLAMGICYFVIVMLVSLLLNRVTPMPMGSLLTVFIICSFSGMLGGMVS
jgi:putative membrane protein (TIGR04086 family)